ncbi:unnamed protein product [Symbiodinium sp. KB8]|nr:unnamed protein product [Symbiodinium sp. KB8]
MVGVTAYLESQQSRMKRCQMDRVVQCSLINFVSPCLIKADHQGAIFKFLQHSLADVNNVAVLLNPLFSYKKNGRYAEEHAVLQRIAMTGVQMDRVFSMLFSEKLDDREDRPLSYPGHLLTSVATDTLPAGDFLWRKSTLFKRSRTPEAKQLGGREMISVEEVGETSMPASTSIQLSGTVKGAQKWAQVGPDAATKLLQSLVASRWQLSCVSCCCLA